MKKKNEQGAITIEATISLSAFAFAIVTILSIVNICLVQAKMSYAIHTTAKEISQYSYLYSLTGLLDREKEIYNSGVSQTSDIQGILTHVNEAYNAIEDITETGQSTPENVDDILNAWDSISGNLDNIGAAASGIEQNIQNIASDPKNLLFGIAKLGAVEAFDLVKSKLIGSALAKAMCKKHFCDEQGGDAEAYLKHLGVVPGATGSYMDGLDFSKSVLFPYGSSTIGICVSYDVKVIALLPIDFTFHFEQRAITHGWLAGDISFEPAKKYVDNDTLWTNATVQERSSLVRHLVIADYTDDGYEKTKGLTDVQLYNPDNDEFVMIASMNPLWSAEGESALTLADISDTAVQENIERLCGKMVSTTDAVTNVSTRVQQSDGSNVTHTYDASNASNTIVLVIPEDPGLQEKIQQIINQSNTHGVNIVLQPSFGNGARQSEVTPNQGDEGEGGT